MEEGWKIKQQKPKARGSKAPPGCVSLYVFVIFLHIGIKDKKKEQRMPNSAIRTKTIFLFGAYPEYLQKKVVRFSTLKSGSLL